MDKEWPQGAQRRPKRMEPREMSQTGGKTLDILNEDLKTNNETEYTRDVTALCCSPWEPLTITGIQESKNPQSW